MKYNLRKVSRQNDSKGKILPSKVLQHWNNRFHSYPSRKWVYVNETILLCAPEVTECTSCSWSQGSGAWCRWVFHKPQYWKDSAPTVFFSPLWKIFHTLYFIVPILFLKCSCLYLNATIHLIMVFKGLLWHCARFILLEPRHLQMNLFQLVFQEAIKLSKVY